jgi:hypothetical protein
MAAVSKPHSISIRIFGFLRRYMDTRGFSYAFDKDIDPFMSILIPSVENTR